MDETVSHTAVVSSAVRHAEAMSAAEWSGEGFVEDVHRWLLEGELLHEIRSGKPLTRTWFVRVCDGRVTEVLRTGGEMTVSQ